MRSACFVAVILVAAALVAASAGRSVRTPAIPAFLPSVVSVIVVTDLLSAYIFLGQYLRHGARRLCWLGMAYLSSGLCTIPYLLMFPGLFPLAKALGAGEQTSLYLWIGWHVTFPAFAAVAMARPVTRRRPLPVPRAVVMTGLCLAVVLAIVTATVFLLHAGPSLPVFVHHGVFSASVQRVILPGILAVDVLALLFLVRAKPHSQTSAWLGVALIASMLDAAMGLLGSRYSFSWYTGKIFSMISAGVVLVAYIREMLNLQVSLAASRNQLGRFEMLSEHARDVMVFADRQSLAITDVNTAAVDAFGYSMPEFRTLAVPDLNVASERHTVPAMFEGSEDEALHELTCVRKDGTTFAGEFTARHATVDGRDIVLCVIRDISERRRSRTLLTEALAQAVSASVLKSEFVATMSHEIRTPMNGVIGMSEIVLNTNLDAEQREYVETIRDSGQALLRVVNDVLDFSKIEAGRMDIEAVEFSVENIVEGVVMLLGRTSKAAALTTFVDPKIPKSLRGDPGRLRQVLFNIVGNALKFTESGSVDVSAVRESEAAGRVVVRFTVRDTGIGMDSDEVAKLFEPFVQGDGSTTRRFGGTGLGLSIAKRLIELMGGAIEVRSEKGTGTTFSFTATFSDSIAIRSEDRSEFANVRVLIVDDDDAVRHMLSSYALAWNMDCVAVRGSAEALHELETAEAAGAPFDIAAISASLSEDSGCDLCAQVTNDPKLSQVRIILLTTFEEAARHRKMQAGSVAAFVMKPIVQSQMFDAIQHAMEPAGTSEVTLPEMSVASRESPEIEAGTGSGTRILVVEDNAINRRVAALQLDLLGYRCEMAVNGREALERVHAEPFDLILMDCHMPVMDGYETTSAIRASPSATVRSVAIVAMTAGALERDRQRCLDAGMDGHVTKPVRLEDLRAALERHIPPTASTRMSSASAR